MKLTKPVVILIGAMCLFALRAPLLKWLAIRGENLGLYGHDAFSFCNILFIGNVCAGLAVWGYFGRSTIVSEMKASDGKAVFLLLVSALLEIIPPMLLYMALMKTSVTNVILLSRFGPLLFSILGALVLRSPISTLQWIGYGFSLTAISIVVVYGSGWSINQGDVFMLLAGITTCFNTILNRYVVQRAGLHAFMFTRCVVGAIAFFIIAVIVYGWYHFGDAIQPQIWVAMAFYAVIAVAGAELAWYYALRRVDPKTVGSLSFISPSMGILFASMLLGASPVPAQWLALVLVTAGIVIANVKQIRENLFPRAAQSSLVVN